MASYEAPDEVEGQQGEVADTAEDVSKCNDNTTAFGFAGDGDSAAVGAADGGGESDHAQDGGSEGGSVFPSHAVLAEALNGTAAAHPPVHPAANWTVEKLRGMWEMASVLDFLRIFREKLNMRVNLSAEELESAILSPHVTSDLKDLHIVLLQGLYPGSKPPIDRKTWATILCRRLNHGWSLVAQGLCPLRHAQGEEEAAYCQLSLSQRVEMLRALCELRLDQEDARGCVDASLRLPEGWEELQMEAIGEDSRGMIYWFCDAGDAGQRLWREGPPQEAAQLAEKREREDETRGSECDREGKGVDEEEEGDVSRRTRSRRRQREVPVRCDKQVPTSRLKKKPYVPPPPPLSGTFETAAINLHDFNLIMDGLQESRQQQEQQLLSTILEDVLPKVEASEKKRERAFKRQQRQQQQLALAVAMAQGGSSRGLAFGRSRRERKPVSYTFDDFERSIQDAIRGTRNRSLPQEAPSTREGLRSLGASGQNGSMTQNGRMARGMDGRNHADGVREGLRRRGRDRSLSEIAEEKEIWIGHDSANGDGRGGSGGRPRSESKRTPRQQPSLENVDFRFVSGESTTEEESDVASEEIEGEVTYTEDYIRRKAEQRQKRLSSGLLETAIQEEWAAGKVATCTDTAGEAKGDSVAEDNVRRSKRSKKNMSYERFENVHIEEEEIQNGIDSSAETSSKEDRQFRQSWVAKNNELESVDKRDFDLNV